MLYFRFDTDKFVAPQCECMVTPFEDGKPVSPPHKEIHTFSLGEIQSFFFKKLRDELSLSEVGGQSALYDVIGIPIDAFSVSDERAENLTGALVYVLSEYVKLPIAELDGKSLADLGIAIEFCKRISDNQVESALQKYVRENNLSYLTEEVLWKNMTNEEQAEKFTEYLEKIGSEGSELIIIDPYLFNSKETDYCEKLVTILNNSKAQSITVITDQKHCKIENFDEFLEKIKIPLSIKNSSDFHDRFWIANREAGFCSGTSLNGIGNKISSILMLSRDDIECIIEELNKQSLIS